MAKRQIVAARHLQILGFVGTIEGGTVLGTIETDCEVGSLLSALQFGGASVEPLEGDSDDEDAADLINDTVAQLLSESPQMTNRQVIDALAARNLKVTSAKVTAIRKTLAE